MSEHALDARELLARIESEQRSGRWTPPPPEDLTALLTPMQADRELQALHDRWALPDRVAPGQAGSGWKGLVLRPFGRLVFRVLGPYLGAERELLAQMVRTLDALARRCDELTEAMARRQAAEAESQARLATTLDDLGAAPHAAAPDPA
jgi:hypothetical protein